MGIVELAAAIILCECAIGRIAERSSATSHAARLDAMKFDIESRGTAERSQVPSAIGTFHALLTILNSNFVVAESGCENVATSEHRKHRRGKKKKMQIRMMQTNGISGWQISRASTQYRFVLIFISVGKLLAECNFSAK